MTVTLSSPNPGEIGFVRHPPNSEHICHTSRSHWVWTTRSLSTAHSPSLFRCRSHLQTSEASIPRSPRPARAQPLQSPPRHLHKQNHNQITSNHPLAIYSNLFSHIDCTGAVNMFVGSLFPGCPLVLDPSNPEAMSNPPGSVARPKSPKALPKEGGPRTAADGFDGGCSGLRGRSSTPQMKQVGRLDESRLKVNSGILPLGFGRQQAQ